MTSNWITLITRDACTVRVYAVTIQMTDGQVYIPPEDDPEIGSKHVVSKKNTINSI
jgi:hypothetical protein